MQRAIKCIVCGIQYPTTLMEPLSKKEPHERDEPSNTCRGCWAEWERKREAERPALLRKWHDARQREIAKARSDGVITRSWE